ncbi:hypothetical protein FB451DRAFT_1190060 [Mycena latifolia]|nr:hypothetical protein FB451DRAFT_1190060 [Mycena latifolia]
MPSLRQRCGPHQYNIPPPSPPRNFCCPFCGLHVSIHRLIFKLSNFPRRWCRAEPRTNFDTILRVPWSGVARAVKLDLRFLEVSHASFFPPHGSHARSEHSRAPAVRSSGPKVSTTYFGFRRARVHEHKFQRDISCSAERDHAKINAGVSNASHASHDHIAFPRALATNHHVVHISAFTSHASCERQ